MVFFFEDQIEFDERSLMESTDTFTCIYVTLSYTRVRNLCLIQLESLFFKGLCDVGIMMRRRLGRNGGKSERERVTATSRLKKIGKNFSNFALGALSS